MRCQLIVMGITPVLQGDKVFAGIGYMKNE